MFYFLQDAVFLAVADFFNDVIYIYIYHSVWAKEMRDIPPRCCIYKRSVVVVVVDEGGWILHHLKHA